MNNLVNVDDKFYVRDIIIKFELLKNLSTSDVEFYKNNIDNIKKMIVLYYKDIKPNYNRIVSNFRNKYLNDSSDSFKDNDLGSESLIEKNYSKELKEGIGLVYDFIQEYDIDKDDFNIYVAAARIHMLLYKPLDDLREKEREIERQRLVSEREEAIKKAKEEKNIKALKKLLHNPIVSNFRRFGGNFRENTAVMNKLNIEVPNYKEAIKFMNSFLKQEKEDKYKKALSNPDLFEYIDYCVDTIAELIKYQPFCDGNKRTFRSLLNLMFKKRNIPPVYIKKEERDEYNRVLEEAMKGKTEYLRMFYYYKICDSIYELYAIPFLEEYSKPKKRSY